MHNLITDVPGLVVGHSDDAALASGVTAIAVPIPTSATPLASTCSALSRRVMAADPAHQPHREGDGAEADQHAGAFQQQPRGSLDIRVFLQGEQRKIETRM